MKDNLKIIQAIDFIFKKLNKKYKPDEKVFLDNKNEKFFTEEILNDLIDENCLKYDSEENFIFEINTLKLFDYKRKLLWKTQNTIINFLILEKIAVDIWNNLTWNWIDNLLNDCKVPNFLIIYPNTKWRAVLDIFKILSTSIYEDWQRLLFHIIEQFYLPFRFWNLEYWISKQKEISNLLEFDGFKFEKNKIVKVWEEKDIFDFYENKEWKLFKKEDVLNLEKISEKEDLSKIEKILQDKNYRKIVLYRWKDWDFEFAEAENSIFWDEMKFVDIKKKFPFADIFAKIHNWDITKYTVNEKIKLK